jgi:hypothetical protein
MPHQRRSKSKRKFHGPLRPEDVLYVKYQRTAKRAVKNVKLRNHLTKLQYELQDMSPYGHALVWGDRYMDEARANAVDRMKEFSKK